MKRSLVTRRRSLGFTLIEALIVVSILGVLAALAVAAFSNAAQDARRVIARQQQAEVQNALNAWVTSYTARPSVSLKDARDVYAAASGDLAKYDKASAYLDKSTDTHFRNNSTASDVMSNAMKKLGLQLEFPAWDSTNTPEVELN